MKFRILLLVLGLGLVGGAGLGVRSYLRGTEPAVKAERLAAEGKLRDALVALRTASADAPKDAELHLRIGRLQAKLADPVAAEKEFRAAIALGADRAVVAPDLGEAMLVQGRFKDVAREVPARGPEPSLLAKNLLLRAVAQLSLDDMPAAQATLADAESRAPDQAETALIAARLAASRNDLETMARRVGEVLRRDPDQVEGLLMQGKIMTIRGDRAEAMALTDRAVRAAPWSAMARIDRANQLIYAGEDARAQADVDAVLKAQPRFMDAVYLNGILMARRGKLTEAASQLEKLDSVSARIPQGLYYQAMIALQQGNLQTASEYARRYEALVPLDPDGMRMVARTGLALNRPAAALVPLERLVALAPEDAEVFDMQGRALAALGLGPDAARAFRTAMELAPAEPLYRYHAGAQQLQMGRLADAAALLQAGFDTDPTIPGLGATLLEAVIGLGDTVRADALLARVRTAVGESPALSRLHAALKQRQGDLGAARTILAAAIGKDPASVELKVQLAQVLARQEQPTEALALLDSVLARQPAHLAALALAVELKIAEHDLPAALGRLEAARRAEPRNVAILSMLSDALIAGNDPVRALTLIREFGPDSTLPMLLGGALGRAQVAAGRPSEARETYRAVLDAYPDDLVSRGALAALLTAEKDYAGVKATLEKGLGIEPGNFSLLSGLVANEARWHGVPAAALFAAALQAQPGLPPDAAALQGDLFLAAGQPREAGQAYLAGLQASRSEPLLMKATAALALSNQDELASRTLLTWLEDHPNDPVAAQRLAQLDIQAGRFEQARRHLGIVLAAQPENPQALNNLAWSYFKSGDDRALATARRAYLNDPTPFAADTLGWILVATGSAREAVPLLQRAVTLRPRDPGLQYHLAVALAESDQARDALPVLKTLADAPAFPDQDAARTLLAKLTPR